MQSNLDKHVASIRDIPVPQAVKKFPACYVMTFTRFLFPYRTTSVQSISSILFRFPTETPYAFPLYSTRSACLLHLTVFDFIIL